MLSNAYFLAKFRFDTAENEPAKNLQNFANFPNKRSPLLIFPILLIPKRAPSAGADRAPAAWPARSRAASQSPRRPPRRKWRQMSSTVCRQVFCNVGCLYRHRFLHKRFVLIKPRTSLQKFVEPTAELALLSENCCASPSPGLRCSETDRFNVLPMHP